MKNNILTKYRAQLFGCGAIGTIIVHSVSIINYPQIVSKLCSVGGVGVYIFAFLSGIGLYFSLKNRGREYNKADFYKRRLVRTFLPYMLIAGIWYGIKYLVIEQDILSFFYELSTISYWFEHKGAWYIAMLIPLYLIYPWYHDWLEKGKRKVKFSLTIVVLSSIMVVIYLKSFDQVFASVLIFLIGNYIAEKIHSKQYNPLRFFLFSSLFVVSEMILTLIIKVEMISIIAYAFLGVAMTIGLALILDKVNFSIVNNILAFFGKYSLELYLTNIFLLQAYKYFNMKFIFANVKYGSVLAYFIIIIIGIFSSWMFGFISTKITNSRLFRK